MIKPRKKVNIIAIQCVMVLLLYGSSFAAAEYLEGIANLPANPVASPENKSPEEGTAVTDEEGGKNPSGAEIQKPPAETIQNSEKDSPEKTDSGVSSLADDASDLLDDESPSSARQSKPGPLVADPLIYYNRAMFAVNDKLYFWCLKPVARGYKAITPTFFRIGVRNFFHNLTTPVRLVNSILQGKVIGAGSELSRFAINTTFGVAGVWDPAEKFFDLKSSEEDLGQTLGKYHIGNGIYIVWPLIGSSTLRDTVGLAGDMFLNPVYYVNPGDLAVGIGAFDTINRTSFRLGDYEAVKSASMDPYVMVRDFYIQYRNNRVAE